LIDGQFAAFPFEFDLAYIDIHPTDLQCKVRPLFISCRMA
jgi:hypothetical protein